MGYKPVLVGFVLGVVPVVGALAQTTPNPDVHETATTKYFDIRGISVEALSAELRRLSPMVGGHRVMGVNQGGFSYTAIPTIVRGSCIPAVRVDMVSTTTLPRWIDRSAADSALQRQWAYFLIRLTEHENGHRDIAYAAASDMQKALSKVRAASCPELSAAVNARSREFFARNTAEQAAYDVETDHGIRTGAIWPVPRNVILLGKPPR